MRPVEDSQARPAEGSDIGALGSLMIEFYAEVQLTLSRVAAERTFRALLAAPKMGRVWLLKSAGRPVGSPARTWGSRSSVGSGTQGEVVRPSQLIASVGPT